MKLLTKDTDYAVRALLVLAASPGEYVSARAISNAQKIPYEYLRKIMRKVIDKGFVGSKEGGRGGYKLKKDPVEISVIDVIKIFQGGIQLSECMFRKKICHNRNTCVLRKNINRIEELVAEEFAGITIGGLLCDMKGQKRSGL